MQYYVKTEKTQRNRNIQFLPLVLPLGDGDGGVIWQAGIWGRIIFRGKIMPEVSFFGNFH